MQTFFGNNGTIGGRHASVNGFSKGPCEWNPTGTLGTIAVIEAILVQEPEQRYPEVETGISARPCRNPYSIWLIQCIDDERCLFASSGTQQRDGWKTSLVSVAVPITASGC
jgi:hypothetical protein